MIILASTSPRRKWIFEELGIKFEIVKPRIEEEPYFPPPEEYVVRQAERKANSVKRDGIIFAFDTIVILNGKMLGKPENEDEAFRMLSELSGEWHEVYSGFYAGGIRGYDCSRVKFRKLEPEEIMEYIKTGEPMDKAGAYGAQGYGKRFIEKIEGSYANVIGLPVEKLLPVLDELGIKYTFNPEKWRFE